MLGTIINCLTIVICTGIGILIGRYYNEEMKLITIKGIGLVLIPISLQMSLLTMELSPFNVLIVIMSITIGSLIGVRVNIAQKLINLGEWLNRKFGNNDNEKGFVEGFVKATLLFETGPMAILGAINDSFGDINLLLIKSFLDGTCCIPLSASYGIAVVFSIIPMIIYQGTITLVSGLLTSSLPLYTRELISVIGGLLILGLAINILGMTDISIANYLPSIIIGILLSILIII